MGCKSMTGFGSVVKNGQHAVVKAEIRCVNHRFAEFNLRMPRELFAIEDEVRKLIGQYVARGRVDLFVTLEPDANRTRQIMVDWALLDALMSAEQTARARYDLPVGDESSLSRAMSFPGVLQVENRGDSQDLIAADVRLAVEDACRQLASMRAREGERLHDSLRQKLNDLEAVVTRIAQRASSSLLAYRERLRVRMQEWAGDIDENRLLPELAVFADRVDVDEELVRMQSHLSEARTVLAQGSPVGRRLDFLTQEMHREMNTVGSKSQDAQISQAVVEGKTVIEQLREQAQNLE